VTRDLERVDPELGVVRRCTSCGEEWPRDREFWYFQGTGKIISWCRACYSERNRRRAA
jgi:hypothetical protein